MPVVVAMVMPLEAVLLLARVVVAIEAQLTFVRQELARGPPIGTVEPGTRQPNTADASSRASSRLLVMLLEKIVEVVDKPDLRRDGDALAVRRSRDSVECQRVVRGAALVRPQKVRAKHDPRATLARLAVNREHVTRVRLEPGRCLLAKLAHLGECRRLVVVEREPLRIGEKVRGGGGSEDGCFYYLHCFEQNLIKFIDYCFFTETRSSNRVGGYDRSEHRFVTQ